RPTPPPLRRPHPRNHHTPSGLHSRALMSTCVRPPPSPSMTSPTPPSSPSSPPSCSDRTPCGSPMTPPGLFGSLGPSLLAFALHRPWSIGVNLSLNLHHAPSTVMSHPSPAHHNLRAMSFASVLSILHHQTGANLT